LGLQDHALVSKVCGPNSHACETPIQLDEPLERNVAFNMYFGADEKLFEMCRSRLQGDVDTFEEEGVPLDKQQHPNIPPTRVALSGVHVFRARVCKDVYLGYELERMRQRFGGFRIEVYETDFDDSETKQLVFR
jgi:hypothetical protein